MRKPIRIYLDSSDYSVLSDPYNSKPEHINLKNKLINLSSQGRVEFFYSMAHISEMAALNEASNAAAGRRIDLLVTLCQKNALPSVDRILKMEANKLTTFSKIPFEIQSTKGEWFPDFGNPFESSELLSSLEVKLNEESTHQLNRAERRLLSKKKNLPGKLEITKSIKESELTQDYPFRKEDGEILIKYCMRLVTRKEFIDHFLEGLKDPRRILQWSYTQKDSENPFIEWLRQPSKIFLEIANELSARAKQKNTQASPTSDPVKIEWEELKNQFQLNFVKIGADAFGIAISEEITHMQIDEFCPGLSVLARSLHSVIGASTTPQPRTPKSSDFADCIHAMYAPYVDIFRADSFMAPHVKKQISKNQTIVVSKLLEIETAIDKKLWF